MGLKMCCGNQVGLMLSGKQIDNILVGGPADMFNRSAPENGKLQRGDTIVKVRPTDIMVKALVRGLSAKEGRWPACSWARWTTRSCTAQFWGATSQARRCRCLSGIRG
jgi:hypothetical protein